MTQVLDLIDVHGSSAELSNSVPAIGRGTTWRSRSDTSKYLLLTSFRDEAEANQFLVALADVSDEEGLTTPNSRRCRVLAGGDASEDVEAVTVGRLWSHPGFASETESELKTVLRDLAYVEGFAGGYVLNNEAAEEEFFCIAFWQTNEAATKSLPKNKGANVEVFERIPLL